MYQQLELARSGKALLKFRRKYPKYVVILSEVIAYFDGTKDPTDSYPDRSSVALVSASMGSSVFLTSLRKVCRDVA